MLSAFSSLGAIIAAMSDWELESPAKGSSLPDKHPAAPVEARTGAPTRPPAAPPPSGTPVRARRVPSGPDRGRYGARCHRAAGRLLYRSCPVLRRHRRAWRTRTPGSASSNPLSLAPKIATGPTTGRSRASRVRRNRVPPAPRLHHLRPPALPDSYSDGVYLVGEGIPAGQYSGVVTGAVGYWARLQDVDGSTSAIIENALPRGPFVLTIQSGDRRWSCAGSPSRAVAARDGTLAAWWAYLPRVRWKAKGGREWLTLSTSRSWAAGPPV